MIVEIALGIVLGAVSLLLLPHVVNALIDIVGFSIYGLFLAVYWALWLPTGGVLFVVRGLLGYKLKTPAPLRFHREMANGQR